MVNPRRLVLASLVAVVGLTAAVVWAVTAMLDPVQRPQAFARADLPGQVVVQLTQVGRHVVYYEGDHPSGLPPGAVEVVGPHGAPIAVVAYGADLRYDIGNTIGTAVAAFDLDQPGTYVVTSNATAREPGARLAVGEDLVPAVLRAVILPGTLAVLSVVGAVALAISATRTAPGARDAS